METMEAILGGIAYPGQGLLAGSIGGRMVTACLITARGEAERSGIYREEGDSLALLPYGTGGAADRNTPLFRPLRVCAGCIVLSNGDQTDTICESLLNGRSLQYAMSARCYQPDAPHFTPRIACLVLPTGRYAFGIVKKAEGSADCRRRYWSYDPKEGAGHLIRTYAGEGTSLPPFSGEPREMEISGSPAALAERIWRALDRENRVALYVRLTDPFSGRYESALKNARLGD